MSHYLPFEKKTPIFFKSWPCFGPISDLFWGLSDLYLGNQARSLWRSWFSDEIPFLTNRSHNHRCAPDQEGWTCNTVASFWVPAAAIFRGEDFSFRECNQHIMTIAVFHPGFPILWGWTCPCDWGGSRVGLRVVQVCMFVGSQLPFLYTHCISLLYKNSLSWHL